MMADGPFGRWLLSQLEMMPLHVFREGAGRRLQERLIGRIMSEQEAEELYALLNCPQGNGTRVATVLLPGVMGSLLASVEGISALLWLNPTVMLNGHINLLDLNVEGTGDASPDVRILPVGIEKLVYLKMILALAHETRLFEFPYDWRRHLEWNARLLHRAIARWSETDPERRFVLVGHSMGGMLARTYMALYPREAERRIQRLILLGSPLYGSPLTIMLFYGQTLPAQIVSRLHANNDVVGLVANMPSAYQLLPPPPELFPGGRAYPVNWDLYDAREWRLPIVRQDYLDDARAWQQLVANSDPQVSIVQIAGCHRRTLTDLWKPLREDEEQQDVDDMTIDGSACSNVTLVHQQIGEDSGDNSVPLWSTRCERYGTYYIEEEHQLLPRNNDVIRATLSLIHDDKPHLPQVLPAPIGRSASLRGTSLMEQVAELRQRIEAGVLLGEDLDRLFFAR
jgi:pimeloyl-ACP methyl ester carboxylesterase